MENLFRREVLEHKQHRLEGTISLIQPPVFKTLGLLILTVVILSIVFLSSGSYTRKERVSGVIEPSGGLLRVAAMQQGVVSEVLVKEGEQVAVGQPLLRIASAKHSTEATELNQALLNQYRFQQKNLLQQIEQLRGQYQLDIEELQQQETTVKEKLKELESQASTFQERLLLNQDLVSQIATLKGTGYISELELQRQKDTLLSLKQQASSIRSERIALESQLKNIKNQLAKLPIEHQNRTSQLQSQQADLLIQISSIEQERLGEVRAAQSGVVTGLLAKLGKNVSIGQHLLTLIPEDSDMQAIVYIPTSAFGFIKEGQETKLRYHAFPYEKFGIYKGKIVELSNSVILPEETNMPGIIQEPAYRVVVALDEQAVKAYGKDTVLRAGMTLDADIVVEERSLLRWLFDPVFSIKGQL
ncbi:HlyD family efflux transporter periplasmic adaptor subunit [Pseudoalteromonas sp. CO348]|uniref:HlyD family secretion protein n=1 Tax=Pseudoalteromonas TaxID=53246 RepID=UPI001023D378|nr:MULTISPECIES: HlyD family efflux transporter periplasmic adaptor subunit [Pseudoalteromonas]MCG7540823.1 HlyD family efflux transporter periplasmic adaptor subunit [Pseudoalteromonas sp. OF7H-1]MCG9771454.1 HlyD family efflux transporter periplasmic adaptor subunit [Pseudoalteromonas piscicida]QZO12941.1 HlyD family efflux transporter periplasmic adaptor subunit [Pseudoalteromonas piscicida]RZG01173.1 HlyD family efflux transporter periplasmic adaptor subunit [Pseudoalteromonas sp. CO348]